MFSILAATLNQGKKLLSYRGTFFRWNLRFFQRSKTKSHKLFLFVKMEEKNGDASIPIKYKVMPSFHSQINCSWVSVFIITHCFGLIHFQFKGCQVYFIFTDLEQSTLKGKPCRPWSDATNVASDLVLHCLPISVASDQGL